MDLDGDGRTNLQESVDGTHPRGSYTRYLAEGATAPLFNVVIALANPSGVPATALLRFLRAVGPPLTHVISVPPTGRATVRVEEVSGMTAAEFSTVVESDVALVVDRTMTWDAEGYGSHSETSLPAPALRWYLAEGSTKASFDLYYLLQNQSLTEAAEVTVTYLRPDGQPPIAERHVVPANARYNIHVDDRPGLDSTDVSAVFQVTNGVPILVERAMYVNANGRLFDSGHDAAAVTEPAQRWFLSEGATLGLFDTFVLLDRRQRRRGGRLHLPGPAPAGDAARRSDVLLPVRSPRLDARADGWLRGDGRDLRLRRHRARRRTNRLARQPLHVRWRARRGG